MVPGDGEERIYHFHSLPLASGSHMAISDCNEAGKCNLIMCFNEEEPGYLWTGLMTTRNSFLREPDTLRLCIKILTEHANDYPRNFNHSKDKGNSSKVKF